MTISLLASVCPCRHRSLSCNYPPQACSGPRTINNYSSLAGASSSLVVLALSTAAGCRGGLESDGGKILVRDTRYLQMPEAVGGEQDLTLSEDIKKIWFSFSYTEQPFFSELFFLFFDFYFI